MKKIVLSFISLQIGLLSTFALGDGPSAFDVFPAELNYMVMGWLNHPDTLSLGKTDRAFFEISQDPMLLRKRLKEMGLTPAPHQTEKQALLAHQYKVLAYIAFIHGRYADFARDVSVAANLGDLDAARKRLKEISGLSNAEDYALEIQKLRDRLVAGFDESEARIKYDSLKLGKNLYAKDPQAAEELLQVFVARRVEWALEQHAANLRANSSFPYPEVADFLNTLYKENNSWAYKNRFHDVWTGRNGFLKNVDLAREILESAVQLGFNWAIERKFDSLQMGDDLYKQNGHDLKAFIDSVSHKNLRFLEKAITAVHFGIFDYPQEQTVAEFLEALIKEGNEAAIEIRIRDLQYGIYSPKNPIKAQQLIEDTLKNGSKIAALKKIEASVTGGLYNYPVDLDSAEEIIRKHQIPFPFGQNDPRLYKFESHETRPQRN